MTYHYLYTITIKKVYKSNFPIYNRTILKQMTSYILLQPVAHTKLSFWQSISENAFKDMIFDFYTDFNVLKVMWNSKAIYHSMKQFFEASGTCATKAR